MNGDEAPTSESVRVIERFTPLDAFTIHDELTIDDPGTWTRPWTVAFALQRISSYPFSEYACHKGNYGANVLSAARAAEKTSR